MRPIRIHLGPMPAMLRTIVGDLLRQEPDMVLLSAAGEPDTLGRARDERADILITQEGAGEPSSCLEAILRSDGLGICALAADGRSASAVNLVRRPIAFEEEHGFALADAIRGMAHALASDAAGDRR